MNALQNIILRMIMQNFKAVCSCFPFCSLQTVGDKLET